MSSEDAPLSDMLDATSMPTTIEVVPDLSCYTRAPEFWGSALAT
jgi:hypothetical protein